MGTGFHGGFGQTYGAAAGDAVFHSEPEQFFSNIRYRQDIDKNRTAARLIKSKGEYKRGQPIRLLSCNTGASTSGFAQNLANKLGVVVEAPTKLVWAYPNGKYIVAARMKNNPQLPDLNNRGKFKKFYPGGKRK